MSGSLRELAAGELADWDRRTVDRPGGHIFQSLAWATNRTAAGWQAHHFAFDDGLGVLALVRSWPLLPGGGGAYLPRGPIPAGDPVEATAGRLAAVVERLGALGVDVVATDAEVPAASGYPCLLAAMGFHPIEEIQPARHRLTLPLPPDHDEAEVAAGVAKSTRQRIRHAERGGLRVVRHDARMGGTPGDGFVRDDDPAAVDAALGTAYDLVVATGVRRGFRLGPRPSYLAWWRAAYDRGHLVVLEARDRADVVVATLVLYRHGGRLSTALSGDRAEARSEHPGAFHLLRWRAIQLALREGCEEMDLGGVDVAGARHEPRPGEPMAGLYEHKRSFGATWLELAGAHERVLHPRRYLAGRVAAKAVSSMGRLRGGGPG